MLKLGTFKVDCTPPVGFPIGLGTGEPTQAVRDPLMMHGFVLDNGRTRVLVAGLDYLGLIGSAHHALLDALGKAVDTPVDNVVVHCVHQHDTPMPSLELPEYIGADTFPRDWWLEVCDRCGAAARDSLSGLQQVEAVGHRETRLYGYASNRRILGSDGKVRGMRFSRCPSADLVSQPVGVIDPMLRTLAFRGPSGALLGSMSFYATHPQVANGRGMYSADAPGEAVRLLAEANQGMHAYFSGAFGNITAGKYTSTEDLEGNLLAFGRRLADGIGQNLKGLIWQSDPALDWKVARFPFPAEEVDREEELAAILDRSHPEGKRLVRATVLSCRDYPPNAHYPLKLLRLGGCSALFIPGEPFVEYQLYAQSLIPDRFLGLAGNCGDDFLYLPTAGAFAQEGYEVTSFRWCTEAFEPMFREAVAKLLIAD